MHASFVTEVLSVNKSLPEERGPWSFNICNIFLLFDLVLSIDSDFDTNSIERKPRMFDARSPSFSYCNALVPTVLFHFVVVVVVIIVFLHVPRYYLWTMAIPVLCCVVTCVSSGKSI